MHRIISCISSSCPRIMSYEITKKLKKVSSRERKIIFRENCLCKHVCVERERESTGYTAFYSISRGTHIYKNLPFYLNYRAHLLVFIGKSIRYSIHPEGICSSAACHVTGVPANVLTVLLFILSSILSLSLHFKLLCWSFCSVGLHSTIWMCNESVKFLNLEAPYNKSYS